MSRLLRNGVASVVIGSAAVLGTGVANAQPVQPPTPPISHPQGTNDAALGAGISTLLGPILGPVLAGVLCILALPVYPICLVNAEV